VISRDGRFFRGGIIEKVNYESDSLRKHAYAVEGVMRYIARKYNEDVEKWGNLCGFTIEAAKKKRIDFDQLLLVQEDW
jgi:hypothetical protein